MRRSRGLGEISFSADGRKTVFCFQEEITKSSIPGSVLQGNCISVFRLGYLKDKRKKQRV